MVRAAVLFCFRGRILWFIRMAGKEQVDKSAFVECSNLKVVDLRNCDNITYAESCFAGITTGNGIVISTNGGSFAQYPEKPANEFPTVKKSNHSF